MIRKLFPYTKGYRHLIVLGVLCSAGEAVLELMLPLAMSDIVNIGIENGDRQYILATGIKMIVMALLALCCGVGAAALWYLSTERGKYAMERIDIWLDPFSDPRGAGWQGVQAQLAIGSGGFWGLGLGQSRQKHLYLPEPANDFIFAVWCEEMGFVGAVILVILFALLIWRGYYIALNASDKFGTLLAAGITTQIAFQTFLNLAVVTGLFPFTGASLPFFSYGGTALLILLGEVGILLSVSRRLPVSQ